jgi:hypothetical protein
MILSAHVLRSADQSGNACAAFKALPQYRASILLHALRHGLPHGLRGIVGLCRRQSSCT